MYHRRVFVLIWACLTVSLLAETRSDRGQLQRREILANASISAINLARTVVEEAQVESAKLNGARMDNPARNRYLKGNKGLAVAPPLLEITPEIASAAALLSDAEGFAASPNRSSLDSGNRTSIEQRAAEAPAAGSFWMGSIVRKGTVPWGDDPGYKVFRNVVDYGADPTGQKDSSKFINEAIKDGKRCGPKCNGSTIKNAIVYFPPGTYKVSTPLQVMFGTQMIGDATNWPTIKASASFVGLGVMETDVYIGGTQQGPDKKDAEWYVNTASFYRQIRNFKIDITSARNDQNISCVHYQVAQATSIFNVELIAKTGGTQRGMFAENGSGGVMSDITFRGGRHGFYGGNQQFSAMRLRFDGCDTAAQILWDWGWVWKSLNVENCNEGFRLVSPDGSGSIGSVSFVDSKFKNTKKSIIMGKPSDKPGTNTTGIVLDNTVIDGPIEDTTGKQYLAGGSYKNWVFGPTYDKDGKRSFSSGKSMEYPRQSSLQGGSGDGLPLKPYFERPRPQYDDRGSGDFVHIKDYAKGDGSSDDTKGVQDAFNAVADGQKILHVDAGTYLIGDTVTIPKDAKIVGETWAQFAAFGPKFSDPKSPRVMLKVGNAKDKGTVEMQDLILTTKGATAGAILMEWNVAESKQGSAGLWDVHARIGGAIGTGLTEKECPSSQTDPKKECQAASLMMHITRDASGYFDNMWLWTADHNIDDPDLNSAYNDMPFASIYVARGLLIESRTATWLYGTAAEHATLYQYNFAHAQNIYTTMIQSESPYYQPKPGPPAPFKDVVQLKGAFETDPTYDCAKGGEFSGCDQSWAVVMRNSQNIHIGGAGTYSWFSYYTQDCIDLHTCQNALWYVKDNYENVRVQHIIGIGAKYVLVSEDKGILATDNLAMKEHPAWAQISIFDASSKGKDSDSDSTCSDADITYRADDRPDREGEFRDASLWAADSFHDIYHFINIVNLTPYRFKFRKDLSNQCQIEGDFGDIPVGHARQMKVKYATKGTVRVDDNADYYFDVMGTKHRFHIKATQNDQDSTYRYRTIWDMSEWGLGYREFKNPALEVALNFVITGSEEYGYYTSMDWAASPQGWMRALYPVIKDRQLRHVVMPGTHDSGMSKFTLALGGVPDNTLTQGLQIYDQLKAGARWFDLRLIEYGPNPNYYVSAHLINELNHPVTGGGGESVDDIINEINQFTTETPGEVIFLRMKYLVHVARSTGWGYPASADLMNTWFDIFKKINNRCAGFGPAMDLRTMSEFMDKNGGKGCVIILLDGKLETEAAHKLYAEGIYDVADITTGKFRDYYTETSDVEAIVNDQTSKYSGTRISKNAPYAADGFYISQYVSNPPVLGLTAGDTVQVYAVQWLNQMLYARGVNAMKPDGFPNVIMVDYFGVAYMNNFGDWNMREASLRTLAIGLNLYMVSENCEIDKGKHPLRGPRKQKRSLQATQRQWNGVVFANGTRLEQPPSGFEQMLPTLVPGTRFMNGTVFRGPEGSAMMDC